MDDLYSKMTSGLPTMMITIGIIFMWFASFLVTNKSFLPRSSSAINYSGDVGLFNSVSVLGSTTV